MKMFAIALMCTSLPALAFAQNAPQLLTDAHWLSAHLNDKNLVVLHVGSQKGYDAGHIPGARLINMQDVVLPMAHNGGNELMVELPPAADLRKKLETFGISDDSKVVIYVGPDGQIPAATRILFTFNYLGLGTPASLLNGGFGAWTDSGKALSTAVPAVVAGKLTDRPTNKIVADAELVKHIGEHPNYKLVDARAPSFYGGSEATYEKNGHIPGAVNIPFSDIADAKQNIDVNHLAEVFQKAGIKPGDTVVAYCHIGMQATEVILGARLLGNPVMLYDGSFQDWAINNRGPVVK